MTGRAPTRGCLSSALCPCAPLQLCHPAAGDQLHLAYVRATANMTRQQQANVKALIGRYLHQVAGACKGLHVPAYTRYQHCAAR